ncbi:MAG: TetR/AcrR family transcriptional regulator, partial [Acidobacteriota bacterium]
MPESQKSRELTPRELKRNRILRAAIEVFASKGYFAARMTDVAAEADVADGTLYLYFEGKEHLLMSIFDGVLGRFIDHLDAEISELTDPTEKLAVMVRLHLETVGRDRALANVLQIETRHSRRFMSLFTRGKLGEYL